MRATAKISSPASVGIPATRPSAATAKSTFGWMGTRRRRLLHTVDDGHRGRGARGPSEHGEESDGTGVAVGIERMAEARVRTPDPQRLGRGGRGSLTAAASSNWRAAPGPAVEHAADRAEACAHDGVGVGPHRGDPGGEGRRGEVVVGQQDERGVEGGDEAGLCPSLGQPGPQPASDRAPQGV